MVHLTLRESRPAPVGELLDLLRGRGIVVLAGAGCSTESGIPDYRGPESLARARRPIQYRDFVESGAVRARYWSRSMVGWPRIRSALPNQGHLALARLEAAGAVRGIITQNVDGLHHAAGSRRVVELHGSLSVVRCLCCGERDGREEYQERLRAANAVWVSRYLLRSGPGDAEAAPDGDAELPAGAMESFAVPSCDVCGGIMKPGVVFFGENVPAERVSEAWTLFESGEVLLVVGSSLTVYSGRRFIYRAEKEGMPVAIVNAGPTRADAIAAVKVEGRLGEVLPRVAAGLGEAG
jgi:NAD+-dependent protein deacetylase sirtuin 4